MGLCEQQTRTTGADHWTEVELVCVFILNSWVHTRQLWNSQPKGYCDIRCCSPYSLINKVRAGCATWQLLQLYLCLYHWAEVELRSQCRNELLPWLSFSSAKLPTSGLQLHGQSAYRVSQQPNWTQTWSWNTHWTLSGANGNVSQTCHTVMKNYVLKIHTWSFRHQYTCIKIYKYNKNLTAAGTDCNRCMRSLHQKVTGWLTFDIYMTYLHHLLYTSEFALMRRAALWWNPKIGLAP